MTGSEGNIWKFNFANGHGGLSEKTLILIFKTKKDNIRSYFFSIEIYF